VVSSLIYSGIPIYNFLTDISKIMTVVSVKYTIIFLYKVKYLGVSQ